MPVVSVAAGAAAAAVAAAAAAMVVVLGVAQVSSETTGAGIRGSAKA